MKRIVLFFVIIPVIIPKLIAQGNVKFNLKPNESEKKKIPISGSSFGSFDVLLELKWEEENNQIQILFDRMSIPEEYILCLPLMEKAMLIDDIEDCRSKTKSLWRGKMAKEIRRLHYFMESDDLKKNYAPCCKFVAPDNELEDSIRFDIIKNKKRIVIAFNGLYVLKNEKQPRFSFSKRDMKIECKAKPVYLEIKFGKKDLCKETADIVSDIEAEIDRLKTLKSEAETAKNAKNCFFSNSELYIIKNNRMKDFPEDNPEWNKYSECREIVNRMEKYKAIRSEILNIQCEIKIVVAPYSFSPPSPPPVTTTSAPCRLEEINDRLLSLQMAINAKKVDGKNYDVERTIFYEIKSKTKITSGCPEKMVSSYNNFCKNIEKALNNK